MFRVVNFDRISSSQALLDLLPWGNLIPKKTTTTPIHSPHDMLCCLDEASLCFVEDPAHLKITSKLSI